MRRPQQKRSLVVVGASAGGVEALEALAGSLPADLEATVCVVLHLTATAGSVLPDVLTRAGPLPARHPADGDALLPGEILVAPPDHHLLVEAGTVRLSRGPVEHGYRPSVDLLFRSAAESHGAGVAAVVLSGALHDGMIGLQAVKASGGATLVQDPEEAAYASMPASAIAHVDPDYVLPIRELGPMLGRLAAGSADAVGRP